jgi:hypothetical protein
MEDKMKFKEIDDNSNFTNDSDPVLNKLERKAGASVLQDIALNTYWANTVGKTKYPGVYQLHKQELEDNLASLLSSRMSYRELEDFLVTLGYETGDIRCVFKKLTSLDPVHLEFMRVESVKDTPLNIPHYNLGWGFSKKKGAESYFVMPGPAGIFTVHEQVDDLTRKEHCSFLRLDEAMECLGSLVKHVNRYDMKVSELIENALEDMDLEEPTSKAYVASSRSGYSRST